MSSETTIKTLYPNLYWNFSDTRGVAMVAQNEKTLRNYLSTKLKIPKNSIRMMEIKKDSTLGRFISRNIDAFLAHRVNIKNSPIIEDERYFYIDAYAYNFTDNDSHHIFDPIPSFMKKSPDESNIKDLRKRPLDIQIPSFMKNKKSKRIINLDDSKAKIINFNDYLN